LERYRQAWVNATRPSATDEIQATREQSVRGILVVQFLVLSIITLAMLAGAAAGLLSYEYAIIAFGLVLGTLAGQWFANQGWLEAAAVVPVLLLFLVGVYGSRNIGWMGSSMLFYALSLAMAAITFQGRYLRYVLLSALAAYFGLGLIFHPDLGVQEISTAIAFVAAMIGMSLLLGLHLSRLRVTVDRANALAIEARQYRSELAESEQRLRALVTQAPVGIITIDMDGYVTDTNPYAVQLLGSANQESTLGLNILTLPTIVNSEFCKPIQNTIESGRHNSHDGWYTSIWGHQAYLQGNFTPLNNHLGKQVGALLLFDDFTEGRNTQDALYESRDLIQNVVAGTAVILFALNVEGDITLIEGRGLEALGLTSDEVVGQPITVLFNDGPSVKQDVAEALQGKVLTSTASIRDHHYEVRYSPLMDLAGEITGVTGVAFDVTTRKLRDAEMEAIVTVAQAMRTANSRAEMFLIILNRATELLQADGALIVMEDREKHGLIAELGTGCWAQSTGIHMPQPNSISHVVYTTEKPYLNNDIHSESRVAYPGMFGGLSSAAGVPLIAGEKTVGVLWVGCSHPVDASQIRILTAIGELAANTIHRATLFEDVERTKTDLELAYNNTLLGWASALELRDMETKGHSQRVTDTTLLLAVLMGYNDEELSHIQRGALMHDIGKMGIPDSILLKPGALDKEEWAIMSQHPQYAYDMLESILFLQPALDIPYCHHERWDGSGYPRGLKGEDIPLMARIFAIVDVWDALLSDRPYRKAWPQEKAFAHIKEQSGTHFDPKIVDMFLQMVESGFVETG
jgi:PAS domain S-box-containing protein